MSSLTSSPAPFSTLSELLLYRAANDPERGITYLPRGEAEEERLSFARLDREARRVGRNLAGISSPGDRVLLLFAEGTEVVVAFFAALYAGLVTVPVAPPRPNQPPGELSALLADASVGLVLTTRQMAPLLAPLAADHALRVVVLEDLPQDPPDGSAPWTPVAVPPEALATLLYTSGSTSRPKGVMLSHGHMLARMEAVDLVTTQVGVPAGVTVSWMPLFHIFGLLAAVLQPMYMNKNTVVLPTSAVIERPVRWLRAISRYRASSSAAPNFAFQACLDAVSEEEMAGLDLSSWALAPLGAETIRAETLRQFAERYAACGFSRRAFFTAYGMSEGLATFDLQQVEDKPVRLLVDRTALEGDRVVPANTGPDTQTLVSCGAPMAGQRLLIVHPETLEALGEDAVGEIWNSGPLVADGYWQQPELTAQTFGARLGTGEGPFLRTGDLGFLHGGELYVTGRLKDMLILHGKNIYAVDLEHAAEGAHPALLPAASAAFSVPLAEGEGLVLVHEVRPDHPAPDVSEVAAAVRRQIGNIHQIPVHAVVLVESGSLPRTQTGKLQRYRCREAYLAAVAEAPAGA